MRSGVVPVLSWGQEIFAPSAGLEPAPPAPEAGALSAELRGQKWRNRPREHTPRSGRTLLNCSPRLCVLPPASRPRPAPRTALRDLTEPAEASRQLRQGICRAILSGTMAARPVIAAAVSRALSRIGIDVDESSVHLERPARRDHGDWSTNAALANAKALGQAPRQIGRNAGRTAQGRSSTPPRIGGRGRAGIREPASVAGVAARHAHRGRDRGRAGLRPKRHRGRGEGPDRVHLGQSHRPPACRQRMVGCVRRRHGPCHDPLRMAGAPRVLRQRHRRPDPRPGREPPRPPSRRGRSRGRLPRQVRLRARRAVRRPRRRGGGGPMGGAAHPRSD